MSDAGKNRGRLAYVGTLAGGLAHEIKNPLSTITVNLSMIRDDFVDPQNPREVRTLRRLEVLEKQVHRLEEILEDFLRFARGFNLEPEPADIEETLRDIIDFFEPEAAQKNVRLRLHMSPRVPKVALDGTYFQQAIMNLFINAQQAMQPEGGEILTRVTTSTDSGEGEGDRRYVEISVIDTGPGIAPENLARIFDVYFSTKKGGTGMGLPTTRRIIEEHDGRLTVETALGQGTNFTIRLPAVTEESEA